MDGKETTAEQSLIVGKVVRETQAAKSFVLTPLTGSIDYKAGQFLTVLFQSRSGRQVRRSYSFSSAPTLDEPPTITVKRIPNGEFSRQMVDRVHAGDILKSIGASGFFILPNNIYEYRQLVFIAAGSGITPVFSLIKTLLYDHPFVHVLLIYANKDIPSTIFYRELKELEKKFTGRLMIAFLFSSASDISRSRLTPDLLEALLVKNLITTSPLFYVCGPAAFMRMVHFKLMSLSVPAGRIRREIFHAEKIIELPRPPDTDSHIVNLRNGNSHHSFKVKYPVAILQAAKVLGIIIPYSCETGQCGTCVAHCTNGEVWMARNEVLLDEEVAGGKILTCTGFPVHGDVYLEL